jgi:cephalosporin-C deacetylase-like acetyl esterase
LEFLSEPGIYIPTWVFVPDRRGPDRSAILYVSEQGKEAEALEFGVLEDLTSRGNLVVAVDVRGIGETKPRHSESGGSGAYRHVGDADTSMQYMAWEMNESLLGMRVQDVVRSVDYSLSRSDVDRAGVRVIGKGMGALWSLFAAALDARIARAVCEGGLLSYRTLTSADRYLHGASSMIPDVLQHFDLPQVAAAIADRRLVLLDPVDAMKSRLDADVARKAYETTAQAYAKGNRPERFVVAKRRQDVALAEEYLDLLG